jgi:hypothetical protein
MLTYEIQHQAQYSRGELLLRTFLGWLYIAIPHGFLLALYGFAFWFMSVASFFLILFTGTTPQWYHEWAVKLQRWGLRVSSRFLNLVDGYPEFGLEGKDDKTNLDLPFWQISRGEMLIRFLFGWLYAGIPHGFVLCLRMIACFVLIFLAFFVVLFTGQYPENWHRFVTETLRWSMRLNFFLTWLYKDYPPFSGSPDEKQGIE